MDISITAMIRDGGYEDILIPAALMGHLADAIKKNGHEVIHLANGERFDVVGFMVAGNMTGERMIILGTEDTHE